MFRVRKIVVLLMLPLFFGCSQYQKLLKSTDYELKYNKSMEYYEAGDYMRSTTLMSELLSVYRGTDKAEVLNYTYAKALMGLKDYMMAGHYYRQYVKTFPTSKYSEECQFMSGYCYYLQSPKPRLEQTDTNNAINELQLFVNVYPSSDRVKKANKLIDEMRDKLAYKKYLSAKLYYNLGDYMGDNYLSAVISAQNCLKEFPDTKYREELSFLILQAKYMEATESVEAKKDKRLRDTVDEYYSFVNEYPQSKYMKKAAKMFNEASEHIKK